MTPKNSARRSRAAFTLIELLVVVAIIALLISILLPSLERARASGRQTLCATNMRSIGQAAHMYRDDNREWGIRGIAGLTDGGGEYHIFWTSILRYLSPDMKYVVEQTGPGTVLTNPNVNFDQLWLNQSMPRRKLMYAIFKGTRVYNCPDHPEPLHPLDYVASAFPINYSQVSIDYDVDGGGEAGDRFRPAINTPAAAYQAVYRMKEFDGLGSPSQFILATESHWSLPELPPPPNYYLNDRPEFRFNHIFVTSQLPFGAFPRAANDQRHPGGLNNLFFDGSARTMQLKKIDAGWPNSLGLRLQHFAVPPQQYW